ncbi:MAG: D-glycero-beta-D-manno-heptose 1-phosphate adenylyltransferase [Pelosinus sp.]|nr:D-glycero-beta-D-manno-heptose 1-phosphate adenylyltransferase [Pelosinus sp.]
MKIIAKDNLTTTVQKLKAAGKRIVFTNGCFDILHAGHVRYLAAAKELGDCLIVGLNSDSSVQALKGPTRPINAEDDRAEVLAALAAVDYVVIFSERTAENLIETIRPTIYVKGGDYRLEDIPENKIVAAYGGQTILIPEVPGRSSSNVIKKITENQ